MFRWTRSLRFRLALAVTAFIFLILLVDLAVSIIRSVPAVREAVRQQAVASAELSVTTITDTYLANAKALGLKLPNSMRPIAERLAKIDYFQLIDMQGAVVYDSRSLKHAVRAETITDPMALASVQSLKPSQQITRQSHSLVYPYFDAQGTHTYSVRYFVSYEDIPNYVRGLLWQTGIMLAVFAPLGFMVAYSLLHRRIVQPIEAMRAQANTIASGEFTNLIKVESHDEFGALAQNLNTMAQALTEQLKALEEEKAWKNEFIVLASHNLRTPMTVIATSVSAIKKDPNLSPDSKKFIGFIETRSKELHALIENLLSISMLKDQRPKVVKKPFDLAPVVNTIAKDHELKLREKNIALKIDVKEPKIMVNGDEGQLFQVIDNLVDNAIKFTPERGQVTVTAELSNGHVIVSVKDSGIGIDEKIIKKLFESFHRGADPLSVDNKGAGLGLYFVKLAVEAHGGEVAIKSQAGLGTEVRFHIPSGM